MLSTITLGSVLGVRLTRRKVFGDITGKYFLHNENEIGYQLTGTGNTIDPDRDPMVNLFIRDSLEYWIKTYNIDGFRFDLAGAFDYQKVSDWMTYLNYKYPDKKILGFGEPWVALPDPNPRHLRLTNIHMMYDQYGNFSHFGGFNFPFREAIKGFNNDGNGGGFAFNQIPDVQTVINGLRGSVGTDSPFQSMFAADPVQSINYVSSHDNLTLYDKIEAWSEIQDFPVSFDYKKRIAEFANSIVFMSQGVAKFHSGAEFLRTKFGIDNSYNSPDSVNQIDWTLKESALVHFRLLSTRNLRS